MGLSAGSYLKKPNTDKVSYNESNAKLICGASSMQGWRSTQEDAYNCICDFDVNTSFFSVFDGHCGHEVALYCSQKLPKFLKSMESYSSGDYDKALEQAFLGFDATIITPKVRKILNKYVSERPCRKTREIVNEEDVHDENDYEEVTMPLDEIIKNYKSKTQKLKDAGKSWTSGTTSFGYDADDGVSSSSKTAREVNKIVNSEISEAKVENDSKLPEIRIDSPDSASEKNKCTLGVKDIQTPTKTVLQSGDIASSSTNDEEDTISSAHSENGDFNKKGDGTDRNDGGVKSSAKEEESSSDDEVDNKYKNLDIESAAYKKIYEEPGFKSGCTAVVALIKDNKLYVANAGDSRCVMCRSGQAVAMSIDHKPANKVEKDRICKAGGRVKDGRVNNNGPNLSRAIGDHNYKLNKELSDKEQMMTALPEIKTLTLNPSEDEFIVLASDGIWDCMSSQEVVEFIRTAIKEGTELSRICGELFEHCLSSDAMMDSIGSDNMTAVIVQFKTMAIKRPISPQQRIQVKSKQKRLSHRKQSTPTKNLSSCNSIR